MLTFQGPFQWLILPYGHIQSIFLFSPYFYSIPSQSQNLCICIELFSHLWYTRMILLCIAYHNCGIQENMEVCFGIFVDQLILQSYLQSFFYYQEFWGSDHLEDLLCKFHVLFYEYILFQDHQDHQEVNYSYDFHRNHDMNQMDLEL